MIYLFKNPESDEVVEVDQPMKAKHVYVVDGVKWDRIFTLPALVTQGFKINPFSSKDFIARTQGNGTVGDMFDRAEEMSAMRTAKMGYDPIQDQSDKEYSKKRHGAAAPKKAPESINVEI